MTLKLKICFSSISRRYFNKGYRIKKIIISIKFLLANKISNISLLTNILKRLDLYAYYIHKLLYIREVLMKIDAFIFSVIEEKAFIKIK